MDNGTATGWEHLLSARRSPVFGQSQRDGLTAMIDLATRPAVLPRSPVDGDLPSPSEPSGRQAPRTLTPRALAWMPVLTLVVILTTQAMLSARLISSFTAFNDEALYIGAGQMEWLHWLHGTPIPLYQTYFSGAPVLFPALGALADGVGGLTAARLLSLGFMLGATLLLWSTARRLYDWPTASLGAAIWAVLGPTQHLGAYATYDAMALFLLALAAWFATGRRDKEDATGWILAAAVTLAVANATKYASAIFDPVVIALAVVSAWPRPGGKIALRRGTLLTASLTGMLALLIRLGGPLYLRGIEQTTLERTSNTTSMLTVLDQSWHWIGAVALLAAVAVVLGWRGPAAMLNVLFAVAVLLVPAEQARIHTATSLNKHVDFGAWFAAIAAGYAIRLIAARPRQTYLRIGAICVCVTGLLAGSRAGVVQAQQMTYGYWPNEARLVAALRPLTARGGMFLAEGQYIPEFYLRTTRWQDWSNTRSVILPGGKSINVPVNGTGNPAVYKRLISAHYFSVVLLTFTDTVALDDDIAADLASTSGYRVASTIPFGPTRRGNYTIWVYQPGPGRSAS
ncbi:MAG TPA: glycosyltransferase family 39 protein [Streptosporangiaceae bacterium]|nr:glycosyltransferase family 39 protein [Streptosporangiaceae bacterium]